MMQRPLGILQMDYQTSLEMSRCNSESMADEMIR